MMHRTLEAQDGPYHATLNSQAACFNTVHIAMSADTTHHASAQYLCKMAAKLCTGIYIRRRIQPG